MGGGVQQHIHKTSLILEPKIFIGEVLNGFLLKEMWSFLQEKEVGGPLTSRRKGVLKPLLIINIDLLLEDEEIKLNKNKNPATKRVN